MRIPETPLLRERYQQDPTKSLFPPYSNNRDAIDTVEIGEAKRIGVELADSLCSMFKEQLKSDFLRVGQISDYVRLIKPYHELPINVQEKIDMLRRKRRDKEARVFTQYRTFVLQGLKEGLKGYVSPDESERVPLIIAYPLNNKIFETLDDIALAESASASA